MSNKRQIVNGDPRHEWNRVEVQLLSAPSVRSAASLQAAYKPIQQVASLLQYIISVAIRSKDMFCAWSAIGAGTKIEGAHKLIRSGEYGAAAARYLGAAIDLQRSLNAYGLSQGDKREANDLIEALETVSERWLRRQGSNL